MANDSFRGVSSVRDPSDAPFAITPHDSNPLVRVPKALFIGGAGNVVVRCPGSASDLTFTGLQAGQVLPVRPSHVRFTGTSASNLIGL